MSNRFVALGGGNNIGNSCYYLELDGCRFLLDCGALWQNGRLLMPDFNLLTHQYLDGMWQLDQVVISHAHFDHMGGLSYLLQDEGQIHLLANPITKILTELQLRQFDQVEDMYTSSALRNQYEIQKNRCLDLLQPLSFNTAYQGPGYEMTLYKAGHIPGAAMTYIRTEGYNVLYSGDFSRTKELLAGGYALPEGLPVDVLIVEGTHAYNGLNTSGGFRNLIEEIKRMLLFGYPLTLHTSNVTKGIELARYLEQVLPEVDGKPLRIYLGESMTALAEAFETAHYQVYSQCIQPFQSTLAAAPGTVTITWKDDWKRNGELSSGERIVIDGNAFTLHADCRQLAGLIQQVQPAVAFLVHTIPAEYSELEELLGRDGWKGKLYQVYNGQEYTFH